jgi:hypothetical protein
MGHNALEVAIFSYNRGAWLDICLRSVQIHLPIGTRITVYDDNSDSPVTCAILKNLPADVTLVQPDIQGEGRHGGLYANMRRALDRSDADMLLCLQDDTQIVRPVTAAEIAALHGFMDQPDAPAFIAPLFLLSRKRRRIEQRTHPTQSGQRTYVQINSSASNPQPLAYRDVCLWNIRKIRTTDWAPSDSEHKTAASARALFGAMHLMADPFVAFIPQVPTYRARAQTLGARLAEKRLGREPKPFHPMTSEQSTDFCERDLTRLPFVDDFLATKDSSVRRPYEPNAVDAIPAYRWLNNIELALRKLR